MGEPVARTDHEVLEPIVRVDHQPVAVDGAVRGVSPAGGAYAARGGLGLVWSEEARPDQPPRHRLQALVERVETLAVQVVAMQPGRGANPQRAVSHAQRLQPAEPGSAQRRVLAAQVCKNACPDLLIRVSHPAEPYLFINRYCPATRQAGRLLTDPVGTTRERPTSRGPALRCTAHGVANLPTRLK